MIIITKEHALSISELIEQLEEFKAEHGNLPVAVTFVDYYETNYVYVDSLTYGREGECRLPADSLVLG